MSFIVDMRQRVDKSGNPIIEDNDPAQTQGIVDMRQRVDKNGNPIIEDGIHHTSNAKAISTEDEGIQTPIEEAPKVPATKSTSWWTKAKNAIFNRVADVGDAILWWAAKSKFNLFTTPMIAAALYTAPIPIPSIWGRIIVSAIAGIAGGPLFYMAVMAASDSRTEA